MNINKKFIYFFSIILGTFLLFACSEQANTNNKAKTEKTEEKSSSKKTESSDDEVNY